MMETILFYAILIPLKMLLRLDLNENLIMLQESLISGIYLNKNTLLL